MNNLYDVLEICLQELDNGADLEFVLESVLTQYPDLVDELRPILEASVMGRNAAVPAPSPEIVRRGRAKLLQHASEMREQKTAPRKRMIPFFQRLAISFTLATVFLASGTGLVGASSSALPGEHLYPVKRTWEDVRLFFTFNPDRKELLTSEFKSERLNEVDELLTEGRDETIQFTGVFTQLNGVAYVSGVTVLIPANLQVPADGAAVVITGKTNAQGFVEIESIVLLPDGAVVPSGKSVEDENKSGSDSGTGSDPESGAVPGLGVGSSSENESSSGLSNGAQGNGASATPGTNPQSFEMKGTVESVSENKLIINGQTVYFDNTKIGGALKPGANVEIKGYYAADGSFIVTDVKLRKTGSDGGSKDSNSDSNSNKNNDSNNTDKQNSPGDGEHNNPDNTSND